MLHYISVFIEAHAFVFAPIFYNDHETLREFELWTLSTLYYDQPEIEMSWSLEI